MIHIATAHHRDDTWVRTQVEQLRRHTREPYRLYGSLYGLPEDARRGFDFVLEPVASTPRTTRTGRT